MSSSQVPLNTRRVGSGCTLNLSELKHPPVGAVEKYVGSADIHRQITEVYGTETMSDSKGRKWVKKFKDVRTNVHDEKRSARPSVITDDLMQVFGTKIRENRRSSR
ncbi:HTH_48 domain-containing protein [Trichonephila clavipes]|nr:HTH_48 domain-containing protein [Trichonephila clavipes]